MRHLVASLLALSLTATALSATEARPADDVRPEVVPTVVADAESRPEAAMNLTEVQLEERSTSSDAAAVQVGPRGSFWWVVAVIVVAGVILAVVL